MRPGPWTVLALTAALPVLAGGPQHLDLPVDEGAGAASNMGFLVTIESPASAGQGGVTLRGLPRNLGTGDIADAAGTPPCSESGAPRADGIVDALDLACDLWVSRQGALWISHRTAAGAWESRGVWRLPGGDVAHGGTWTGEFTRGETIAVQAFAPPAGSVANAARLTGSDDPSQPCPVVGPVEGLLNVFYHSMLQTADDLLCGLKDHDWFDADADGLPDTCDASLFDPALGGSACVSDVRDGAVRTRCVIADPSQPSGLRFEGTLFPLEPTYAASVAFSPEQDGAAWCQPHF
jgi:hypothetical protein